MHLPKTITIAATSFAFFSLLAFSQPGDTNDNNKAKEAEEMAEPQDVEETLYLKVYNNIIAGNCAIPACHDGSFEPNFLTPQSTYFTIVDHPVVKKDLDNNFSIRVVPGDTSKSVLIERLTNCCFNDPQDKMPLLGEALSKQQIDSIALWILEGAPDWKGEFPYRSSEAAVPANVLE